MWKEGWGGAKVGDSINIFDEPVFVLGDCVSESVCVEYQLTTEVMDERVEEQTCVRGAESLGDLEEGHGDGDEMCVCGYSVKQGGACEVFDIFDVCCAIEEVRPMPWALE